uniref:Dephospho-CoA kinase n=1 Tax=Glycine max TaxID=3847 RepID=C6TDM8_SOYBN|nr:unknown [Glycine max]
MRIVGLTGGIASGKSTVSNLFKSHDVPVVDADIVAREVLRKGSGGWKKVVAAFGDEILLENGEVNRPSLGQIVFSDPDKRQFLNRLLAPYISRGIFWDILKLWMKGYKVIVLDVPLLFEAKMDRFTKPVIVVWVILRRRFSGSWRETSPVRRMLGIGLMLRCHWMLKGVKLI